MAHKLGPIESIESADEVQAMLADFDEFPEAYTEQYREASLAVARNQAGLRIVKKEIERLQRSYHECVSSAEIEVALALHSRLDGLRAVLDSLVEKGRPTIPADTIAKSRAIARQVLGQRLGQIRKDAEAAAPPELLNPDAAKATNEEKFAARRTQEWWGRFDGFSTQLSRWLAEEYVTDLIPYVQRGQAVVHEYSTLVDQAKEITQLVQTANEAYARHMRITHLVEIAQKNVSPWEPFKDYKANTCVSFGGNVYYTGRDGQSGKTEPKGSGQSVHDGGLIRPIIWTLLGPIGAFKHARKN